MGLTAGRKNRGTTFPDEAIAKKTRENTHVGFYSYPNDLGTHSFIMNFVKFKMGYQSSPTDDIIASIAFPLPGQGIVDKSAVKYNQDELGVVGGAIAGAVSKIKTAVDNRGNLAVTNQSGGEEGSGFDGMEELFYHPESYDCMAFDNTWDAGAMGTTCGYFVPIYQNLDGFIDEKSEQ